MSSMMKAPKMPEMPDTVKIPNANDPELKLGQRAKAFEEDKKRKGRSSTNLAGGGSAAYSRSKLG